VYGSAEEVRGKRRLLGRGRRVTKGERGLAKYGFMNPMIYDGYANEALGEVFV
jgi:hypothetical protein